MSPVPAPARLPSRAPGPSRTDATTARPSTPRSTPARPDATRPRLRLVDNTRLEIAARRRRARRSLVVAGVLAVAALLALAGVNAVLVSNQVRLDALEQQVVEAQARHQALRLEVATLEAPARVVSTATDRLGMVPPERITYVQPSPVDAPSSAEGLAPSPGSTSSEVPVGTATVPSWGTVKPYLSR